MTMVRVSKIFVVLSLLFLCELELCSSNTAVQSLRCRLPNSTVFWVSNPETKTVEVEWKYGNNNTCYTSKDCYGVDNMTTNGVVTSMVGAQLRPVQLQRGNQLRFNLHRYVNTTYPNMYKVNATGFRNCNVSSGKMVRKDNGSNTFDVPSELLDFGNNYFIVATNYSVFISCDIGLRLNVTVKTENCTGNETGVCGGRGTCVTNQQQDNFACHCCGTYKGENCSVFDACISYPCQNGGECLQGNGTAKNATRGYQCKCAIGYHGANCEHKAQNLCDLITCHNGGICNGNATAFNCTCAPGWAGSQCEVDINDCASVPCRHGHCVDKLNGHECWCYPGYYGENCDYQRTSCKFSPCQNEGFCENKTTSLQFKYACHCPPGWNGTDCSQKVSACQENTCTSRGFCLEKYNGFKCVCQPGFTGHRCEININECEPNPCHYGGQCYDLEHGHLCRCVQTHYGSNCQYTVAENRYNPFEDGIMTHVVIVHEGGNDNRTLIVVMGVITAGILGIVLILAGCYFRSTDSNNRCAGVTRLFTRKPSSDLTVQVNVSNTADCPLTSDSFFKDSQHNLALDNKAFQSEVC